MSDYKEEIVLFVLFILVFIAGATLGFIFGWFDGFGMPRSTAFVVESANIEEVTTNTGLVVKNKGFNVGDTLVIRKK
jgi:hypothetical protein